MRLRLSPSIEIILRALPPVSILQHASSRGAPEINSEFDGIGDGDVDVYNLKTAERERFERKCVALQLLKQRFERAAGERAEFSVAFAFEFGNVGHAFVADVELGVDVDVSAGEKFLGLDLDVSGKRSPAPRAHGQANSFEIDSPEARFLSAKSPNCFFQIQLRCRNHQLPFACPVNDQYGIAVGVDAFVKNDVAHFHPQIERQAANGNVSSSYVDGRRFKGERGFAFDLRRRRSRGIEFCAVEIDPQFVDQGKYARPKIDNRPGFL